MSRYHRYHTDNDENSCEVKRTKNGEIHTDGYAWQIDVSPHSTSGSGTVIEELKFVVSTLQT